MAFESNWTAEVLRAPPLIAPARQYIWPRKIAGEEDALARGALNVVVKSSAGSYLVTAALGFKDPSMPTGVFACPTAGHICIVAGGYSYVAPAADPEQVTLLAMKPVVGVIPAEDQNLLLFVGFQTVLAWGPAGLVWETDRLSWEGVRVAELHGAELVGFGWDLMRDVEVEFRLDLRTGRHTGGAWKAR